MRSSMRRMLLASSAVLGAASFAGAQPVPYVLDSHSVFTIEPCLGPCDCVSPPLLGTLRGTFDLRLITVGDVFDFYEVLNVQWVGTYEGIETAITGSGLYSESTHLAGLHHIELDLVLGDYGPGRFESDIDVPLARLFTFIDINANTEVLGCTRFTVDIRATPVCRPDFDRDGFLTGLDFDGFVTAFEQGWWYADFNGDGFVTGADFDEFVESYESGC